MARQTRFAVLERHLLPANKVNIGKGNVLQLVVAFDQLHPPADLTQRCLEHEAALRGNGCVMVRAYGRNRRAHKRRHAMGEDTASCVYSARAPGDLILINTPILRLREDRPRGLKVRVVVGSSRRAIRHASPARGCGTLVAEVRHPPCALNTPEQSAAVSCCVVETNAARRQGGCEDAE